MGIDQGGCYSPDALNIFLHTVHDLPLDAVDEVLLWFRYADNLAYAVPSMSEGHRVLNLVRRLLHKAGLSLKEEGGIIDLNTAKDNPAQLLGFNLWREDGRLRIGLGEACLTQLQEHLTKAWETPDPVKTAITILRGWINAYGPAFENGAAVMPDVLQPASQLGFREIPEVDELTGMVGGVVAAVAGMSEACSSPCNAEAGAVGAFANGSAVAFFPERHSSEAGGSGNWSSGSFCW